MEKNTKKEKKELTEERVREIVREEQQRLLKGASDSQKGARSKDS